MDKDYLKTKINYEINLRNTMWTLVFLIAGGTVSLLFKLNSQLTVIVFILGIILTLLFINGCFKKEEYIESLLDKLKAGD